MEGFRACLPEHPAASAAPGADAAPACRAGRHIRGSGHSRQAAQGRRPGRGAAAGSTHHAHALCRAPAVARCRRRAAGAAAAPWYGDTARVGAPATRVSRAAGGGGARGGSGSRAGGVPDWAGAPLALCSSSSSSGPAGASTRFARRSWERQPANQQGCAGTGAQQRAQRGCHVTTQQRHPTRGVGGSEPKDVRQLCPGRRGAAGGSAAASGSVRSN